MGQKYSALLALVATFVVSTTAMATKSYYIDECTNYQNGTACDIATVNNITSSLQTQLSTDGWSGIRYPEGSAWPQDYWESCSTTYGTSGVDQYYGDSRVLSVFAGHGGSHYLAFSTTGNGGTYNGSTRCGTDMQYNMRLGEMSGAGAAFGMWLACDVIQSSEMGSNMYQSLRQQAGWQNSISIGDNEPRDFYNATSTQTNASAWLNQMSSGGRNAIIVTFSSSSCDDCWGVHNSAELKGDVYNYPRNNGASCGGGQPWYCACWQTRQN